MIKKKFDDNLSMRSYMSPVGNVIDIYHGKDACVISFELTGFIQDFSSSDIDKWYLQIYRWGTDVFTVVGVDDI